MADPPVDNPNFSPFGLRYMLSTSPSTFVTKYPYNKMAGAMALPAETWLVIAHFSETRDMAALVRTNRRLHNLINRELYRTAMEENLYPMTVGAVKAGNMDTLKAAAAYGANLDTRFPYPLCDQVLSIWDTVHNIDRRPDMDEVDKEHNWAWAAPLHVAVMQGRYEIVEWLIKQGVDLENPGRHLCGCLPIIHRPVPPLDEDNYWRTLCQYPAWTPLHYAICHKRTSVARLLLGAGACSTELVVPPASAESLSWDRYYLTETNERRTQLLESSRDDDSSDIHSISALHSAADSGDETLISDLINTYGLAVDIEDGLRSTPLHYAITASNATSAKYIMSLGANPDHGGDYVGNAFDWARLFKQPYLLMQLLASKGSPWFEDSDGIKRPTLKMITSSLKSSLELEQQSLSDASEIFRAAIPTIIRRTRETHIPDPGSVDLEIELAIAFLHACPAANLSNADLHFLLEASGLSLDMELIPRMMEIIPRMVAEDLNLMHGLSFDFTVAVCRNRVHESRCTLRQLALCLIAMEFPLDPLESSQQLLLNRRLEYLLDPPGTRTELVRENASLSPLTCLFDRVVKSERRYLGRVDIDAPRITLLSLCPTIKILGQAGEWFPLGKATQEKQLWVLEKFCEAAMMLGEGNKEDVPEWEDSVIEGMSSEVRETWESEEMIKSAWRIGAQLHGLEIE